MANTKLVVIAVGGNALIKDPKKASIADQFEAAEQTAASVVKLVKEGWRVVLTHGNGPQVGFALRRSELAAKELAPVPMDYAIANTQGTLGYMFQKAFHEAFAMEGLDIPVATVITQTVVSKDDAAFANPSKPIGSFYDKEAAEHLAQEMGWTVMEDSGRGWRRCVPSPAPLELVELRQIQKLSEDGYLVIACGGGGVPVVREGNILNGIEGVIDKDLTSALLATLLRADYLVIPTAGGDGIALDFGKPTERRLAKLTYTEAKERCDNGYFAKGSMLEKVMATVKYTGAHPEGTAIITTLDRMLDAIAGKAGTQISQRITTTEARP
ncbi:MAG: carbamate kinase [Spirochaetales bacterium]